MPDATPGRWEFTVEVETPNPLNSSQGITRGGMFARSNRRKTQREAAFNETFRNGVPTEWPGNVVIELTLLYPVRGLDSDAVPAALKSVRDGVSDAIGFSNDNDKRLTWRYAQRKCPRGEYGVEVVVTCG